MYLTGFADEASKDLAVQIQATKELGWQWIESRRIGDQNIHDLDEAAFDAACEQLTAAGVGVNCFGSTIGNWATGVEDDFDETLARVERAIPRMQRLGTPLIRIMSFRIDHSRSPEDQNEEERFRRLREIVARFTDAGLTPVHENCMNYGGMGWTYTQRMLDNVPGLKLVFDTGNPTHSADKRKPEPCPRQSSWEFYREVREHIAYVHIKDAVYDWQAEKPNGQLGKPQHTMPGEGHGDVRMILSDLLDRGYDGGISIEPHLGTVFHEDPDKAAADCYQKYVAYGQQLMAIIRELGHGERLDHPTQPQALPASH